MTLREDSDRDRATRGVGDRPEQTLGPGGRQSWISQPESRVLETYAPPCSRPPPQRGAQPGPDRPRVAGARSGAAPGALQAEPRYPPHGPLWSRSTASPWAPARGWPPSGSTPSTWPWLLPSRAAVGGPLLREHRLRSRGTLSSKVSPVPCAKSQSFSARTSRFCVRATTPEIPQKTGQADRQTLVFLDVRVQREAGGQGGLRGTPGLSPHVPSVPSLRHPEVVTLMCPPTPST